MKNDPAAGCLNASDIGTPPYLLRHPSLQDLSRLGSINEGLRATLHDASSTSNDHHAEINAPSDISDDGDSDDMMNNVQLKNVSRNSIFDHSWSTPEPYTKSRNDIFNQPWKPIRPFVSSVKSIIENKPVDFNPSFNVRKNIGGNLRKKSVSALGNPNTVLPPSKWRHYRDISAPVISASSSSNDQDEKFSPKFNTVKTKMNKENSLEQQVPKVSVRRPTICQSMSTGNVPLIQRSSNLNLFLIPIKKNLLGVGAHAEVYKAKFTVPEDPIPRDCAAKRLFTDAESQRLGLTEAFMLRKLARTSKDGQHSNIIEYMGIKDEADAWSNLILNNATTSESNFTQAFNSPALCARTYVKEGSSCNVSPLSSPLLTPVSPANESELSDFPEGQLPESVASHGINSNGLPGIPTGASLPATFLSSSPFSTKPRLVVLLEYCSNGNLSDWMSFHKQRIGRRLFFKWARQLALALEHVHSIGMIHTDIKPQNILLTSALDVKLSDFGTALFIKVSRPSMDGLGRGTGPYCAPELFDLSSRFGSSADIFSLGVALYVVGISGREPYAGMRGSQMAMFIRNGLFWRHEESLGLHDDTSPPNRFLNKKDIIPAGLLDLLKNMTDPDASKRPTASVVGERLAELDNASENHIASESSWGYHGIMSDEGFLDNNEKQIDFIPSQRTRSFYI